MNENCEAVGQAVTRRGPLADRPAKDPVPSRLAAAAYESGNLLRAGRAASRNDIEAVWLEEAAITPRPVEATVVAIEGPTRDVRLLRLLPVRTFPFKAGQFARLTFGSLLSGSYSMANRPDERLLEFHVPLLPGGVLSRYVASDLRIGDVVTVEGPYGDAHLRDHPGRPLIAVAGATGYGRIRSIVRTALATRRTGRVHLYLAFAAERDVYCADDVAALKARHPRLDVQVIVAEAEGGGRWRRGMAHRAISADLVSLRDAVMYVAGPPPMVEAVKAMAAGRGVSPAFVFADAFVAAPAPRPRLFAGLTRLWG